MLWGIGAIHWLHVICAITWFGGTIYRSFVLYPVLMALPAEQQWPLGRAIKERGDALLIPIGLCVIGLGIVRGTVVGQIQSLDALGTAYGITWLIALVLGFVILGWDIFAVGGVADNLYTGDDQPSSEEITLQNGRLRVLAFAEIGLFALIFTCMIAMRFGY